MKAAPPTKALQELHMKTPREEDITQAAAVNARARNAKVLPRLQRSKR
jgi:hypothetical protein